MTDPTMPADLARLWRLTTPSGVGRPAALDVDTVVRAAVELADRDGLAGVTLQKVAAALGFTKMALYRHVGSKDELFELMVDHATGQPPDLDAAGWRAGVRQWAFAIRAKYAERPWLADAPLSGPPRGPNAIGWMDSFLGAIRDTGLTPGTQAGVLNMVTGYIRHTLLMERQLAAARGADVSQAQMEQDYGRAMAVLVDPNRFPNVAALFGAEVFEEATEPTDDFAFGLDLILDGVAVTIVEHGGPA